MNLVLDTSAYSEIYRGNKSLLRFLEHNMSLTPIVLGELRSGFELGDKKIENEKLLQRFLSQDSVTVLDITDKTTRIYAQIFEELRKAGTPIGTNDMWIAALCLEHKLPLLTLDSDFASVPELECLAIS